MNSYIFSLLDIRLVHISFIQLDWQNWISLNNIWIQCEREIITKVQNSELASQASTDSLMLYNFNIYQPKGMQDMFYGVYIKRSHTYIYLWLEANTFHLRWYTYGSFYFNACSYCQTRSQFYTWDAVQLVWSLFFRKGFSTFPYDGSREACPMLIHHNKLSSIGIIYRWLQLTQPYIFHFFRLKQGMLHSI